MSIMDILSKAVADVKALDPNAPAVQVLEAAVNTIINPTPEMAIEDIQLVYQIAKEVQEKLNGKHPGLMDLVRIFLNF